MSWKQLRAKCLSMPGAEESFPFGSGVSVFKAGNGKIFAISSEGNAPPDVSVKCDPERAELLREDHESIVPGYHLNKRHWITVTLNADAPDPLVRELIEDSYDLVKPRRP